MKHLISIVILCAVVLNAHSQQEEVIKTAFGNGKPHMGYFVSPSCQFSKMAGSMTVFPGLGISAIFNNRISLGAVYRFSVNENTPPGEENSLYLHSQMGLLRCEYTFKPTSIVHFSFPLELGVGEIETDLKDSFENRAIDSPSGDVIYANIVAGTSLEINLQKNLKLNIEAGYRFVSDFSYRTITQNDIKGFCASASLKIGIF